MPGGAGIVDGRGEVPAAQVPRQMRNSDGLHRACISSQKDAERSPCTIAPSFLRCITFNSCSCPSPCSSWGAGGLHPPFATFLTVRRSSILHFYCFLPAILQLVGAAHSARGVWDEPFPLLIFLPHGSAAAPGAARTGSRDRGGGGRFEVLHLP